MSPKGTTLEDPKTTAVAPPIPVALTQPDADTRGMDGIDGSEDVTFPRLSVAQKTSPQLDPSKVDKYIDGLKLFQMFDSLSGENLGNGPVPFVVIRTSKRALEFDAQNNIVRKNVPLNDPGLAFGPNGERPKVTLFREYLILRVDTLKPMVLSFKGTQHNVAKDLNSFLMTLPKPIWKNQFELRSTSKQRGAYTTAQFMVRPGGPASDDAVKAAAEWYTNTENFTDRVDDREAATADPDSIPF